MRLNHVGEVIESSTRGFVARSQNVGESPHFGYFVKTKGEPVVYGLVYEILTESKEPGRKPTTYGMSIEELRSEQPLKELWLAAVEWLTVTPYQVAIQKVS